MKRRRLIAIISLCTLAAFGTLAVVGGLVVMNTDMATNFVQARLTAAVKGSVYVGRISGNPFSGITIDSLLIRDTAGEVVLATGKVSTLYDVRDLIDNRIYLRRLVAEHPYLHLRLHANGTWNYKGLFASNSSGPKRDAPGRTWGDFVVLDSVRATGATFMLSLPWSPDDSLRGTTRDSVIRHELGRKDRLVRKTADGYARTYMWTRARGVISHARLVDPDSTRFGQEVHIASLDVNEFDPPFRFRNLKGVVRRLGDSAWLSVSHWDMPRSTGTASGKLVWGSNLPIRYDILVHGDSVALADVSWVYPTLPTTGGGKMDLTITNKRNPRMMDYRIHALDVRSTGSHLTGEMTFGVGGPVLQVRNVNLAANPLDFALIEALSGKPLPIDWRGQIFGDIQAPGGPLTDFEVDAARGTWHDSHVPGAVSRLSGSGGLNILVPALTEFHDFDVNVGSLDLRSIVYLFPAFPKLKGTLAGRATLDSSWTDVRFRDADITHRDGPGTPSRFTGRGRVTDGSPFITYDVNLVADPLSFETLARSFPAIKLRGLGRGPISIRGQSPDLQINAVLASAGGTVRFAGNIDIDPLGGYGARGRGGVANVNLAQLLTKPTAPLTSLNGLYTVNVRGSSAATLSGLAEFRLDSSMYDRVRVDSLSLATIRFDRGKAFITDSIRIRSPMGTITAVGALGLPSGSADSINVTLTVDSVGGLRPYFASGQPTTRADSLVGVVTVNGVASGRLDSLFIHGTIAGENLFVRGIAASALTGTFSLADVLRSPHGTVAARLGMATLGGLRFDTIGARIDIADTANASFLLAGNGSPFDSLTLKANGSWTSRAGATVLRLGGFDLGMGSALWTLDGPATLTTDSTTVSVDSLGLRNGKGGSIGLAGSIPQQGAVNLRLSAARVPLADIDRVVGRVRAPLAGLADLSARVTGTRDLPIIGATASLDSIAISDVRIGRLLSTARYANQRAAVDMDIYQGERRVLHAVADSLPLSVKFFSYDTLPGRVRLSAMADSADFTLIQAFIQDISNVKGKVFGQLDLDGTWNTPNLRFNAALADGALTIDTLGISLTKVTGGIRFASDTLRIDSANPLHAQSGDDGNTASLTGFAAFQKWTPNWFDLSMEMRNFQAYNRPELATIYARTDSGPVKLVGSYASDVLTGIVMVDRGAIYLPDPKLAGKTFSQQVGVPADVLGAGRRSRDTALFDLVTQNLRTDLRVHLGGEFKLSADYADIPLAGDLRIVPVNFNPLGTGRMPGDFISRLAPEGTITADRGTYWLELLPWRKRFDVDRGGTITFDRDAEWNGVLNISARNTVRPFGKPEVPIIVDVTGRLLTPRVKLRSDATYPISESDLISYLIFGQPGFDLLGGPSTRSASGGLISALLTPWATSIASEGLSRTLLGKYISGIRLETANLDQSTTNADPLLSLLYSTRLSGETEIVRDKVYLSISAGLCGFDPNRRGAQATVLTSLRDQLGANIDWRLQSTINTGATWQFASEPSTKALLCSPSFSGIGGTAPTPRQFSVSFLKFWRW